MRLAEVWQMRLSDKDKMMRNKMLQKKGESKMKIKETQLEDENYNNSVNEIRRDIADISDTIDKIVIGILFDECIECIDGIDAKFFHVSYGCMLLIEYADKTLFVEGEYAFDLRASVQA
jgi:hypothetical protein